MSHLPNHRRSHGHQQRTGYHQPPQEGVESSQFYSQFYQGRYAPSSSSSSMNAPPPLPPPPPPLSGLPSSLSTPPPPPPPPPPFFPGYTQPYPRSDYTATSPFTLSTPSSGIGSKRGRDSHSSTPSGPNNHVRGMPHPSRPRRGKDETLAVLLRALVGNAIILELDDDSQVRGTLKNVSEDMDVTLADWVHEPISIIMQRCLDSRTSSTYTTKAKEYQGKDHDLKDDPAHPSAAEVAAEAPLPDPSKVLVPGRRIVFVQLPDGTNVKRTLDHHQHHLEVLLRQTSRSIRKTSVKPEASRIVHSATVMVQSAAEKRTSTKSTPSAFPTSRVG